MFTPLLNPDLARLHQFELLQEAERRRFARDARLSAQAVHHPGRVTVWWERSLLFASRVMPRSTPLRPAL